MGLEPSALGYSGHVWDVPGIRWTWGLTQSRVGCSGHVWDIPGLPRTLGSGIRALHRGTLGNVSRMSPGFLGLWDGMDSGIRALHSGTLGTCPGCPWASWDSGTGWTVGLEPFTVGRSGRIRHVPGLPGTLGWDGQWDCSHLVWDDWDVPGLPGILGWDGMDSGIAAI